MIKPEPGTYMGFKVIYNRNRDSVHNPWWWSSNVLFFKVKPVITDIRQLKDPGLIR